MHIDLVEPIDHTDRSSTSYFRWDVMGNGVGEGVDAATLAASLRSISCMCQSLTYRFMLMADPHSSPLAPPVVLREDDAKTPETCLVTNR